jgi:hypothetical protein
MKRTLIVSVFVFSMLAVGLFSVVGGARAHDQEVSVDWIVAYANIRVLSTPIFTHYTTQSIPLSGPSFAFAGVSGATGYPTIPSSISADPGLKTGDFIVVTWSFRYVAGVVVRGDLFWITRLGLDFATIGRYITCTEAPACPSGNQWIGASSFELIPNARYDPTLVLRSIQPTFRHLHVGVSVQNVGNIPAAPTTSDPANPPPGGPQLYGIFTDAKGSVVEPLQGMPIGNSPFGTGTFTLLAPWPWAVASLAAQIVIGFVFIGIMWWYGRYESRKGAKT